MILANNELYNINDLITRIKSDGYNSFTEFTHEIIKTFDSGNDIDIWIPTYAINIFKLGKVSDYNEGFLLITIKEIGDFKKISKDSNGNFLSKTAGCFSIYNNFDNFPIARMYRYDFKSNDDMEYIKEHFEPSNFNTEDFDTLVDKEKAKERIKQYLKKTDDIFERLTKYTQGKIDNTSITGGFIIARQDNICAICNKNESLEIEEIALTSFESGVQTSLAVCKDCISESVESNQILNLMFQDTNIMSLLNKRKISIEDVREISNKIVEINLECKIEKFATNMDDTITAITKNGFILKLRLTTLLDYGYMILSSEEVELIRFDSANHHDDKIEFMPHHVHNDVVKENEIKNKAKTFSRKKSKEHKRSIDITDSFLTGFLGVDYISIKNKILELDYK
ncbi:MAG: hypothetical protein COB17_06755 [Sulfurimonas sp.]|nr:MAG: hypothetical protein COB17_06755 [Sulfurimonas sp.]